MVDFKFKCCRNFASKLAEKSRATLTQAVSDLGAAGNKYRVFPIKGPSQIRDRGSLIWIYFPNKRPGPLFGARIDNDMNEMDLVKLRKLSTKIEYSRPFGTINTVKGL